MINILNNTERLQTILETLKTKAEGGITLPTLDNEGTAADLFSGKELIDGEGNVVTGTMPTVTQATPSITVKSSGLITATATQTAGYVTSGTKSNTKQLTTKAATTYTPTTSNQTIASGTYLTGVQTIKGDANLKASNIKSGVSIFGVNGTLEGSASEIRLQNKTITSNGTYTADSGYDGLGSVTVNVADGDSSLLPSASPKGVNFYDYDGTILYSYTVEEAQGLTELPALPSHEGLICQGWNYDLDTIKSYNRAVNIGAMYITDDGKTRLYIRIAAEGRMIVPLYFSQTVANGVTIDWGDGSSTQTFSGTGNKTPTHRYAEIGDYMITLEAVSGCVLEFGDSSLNYCVMGDKSVYCSMLKKVEIGDSITKIGTYAFYNCTSLTSVTIPDSVTSIGFGVFYFCSSLTSVTIPDSITSIGQYAFFGCSSLTSVVIPDSITSINNYTFDCCISLASVVIPESITSIGTEAFDQCSSLTSVVIPDSVTSIGLRAFSNCSGMAIYDFTSHTSVIILSNADVFSGIPSDCVIKVPSSLYDEWIAETNWATYADYIVNPTNTDNAEPITCYIDGYALNTYSGKRWSDIMFNIAAGEGVPLIIEGSEYMFGYVASEDDGYFVVEGNSFAYLRNSTVEDDYVHPNDLIIAGHNYVLLSE